MVKKIKFPSSCNQKTLKSFQQQLTNAMNSKAVEVSFNHVKNLHILGVQLLLAFSNAFEQSEGELKLVSINTDNEQALSLLGASHIPIDR